jgi:hypothetical protein
MKYCAYILEAVLRIRIRNPVLFDPWGSSSGISFSRSRIPNPYFCELTLCQLAKIFSVPYLFKNSI